jgi:membrane-bound serine protease (ClpP class)
MISPPQRPCRLALRRAARRWVSGTAAAWLAMAAMAAMAAGLAVAAGPPAAASAGAATPMRAARAERAARPEQAPVFHAQLASIIQPVAAEFLRRTLQQADAAGAAAVVIDLDTTGGLLSSTHEMTKDILAARTPVVIYVAPGGAQAASAGFFLLMAADLAAMAPGTRTGAAHPVGPQGETIEGTMGVKIEQDAAAGIRTLAVRNGRDPALAALAVTASRSWSAEEALAGHLADVMAPDLPALLRAIDGRLVHKGASDLVLHTAGAPVREVTMTAAQRLLLVLAHPQLAYLLLMLGGAGLFFEITHPGTLLPGVVGAVALVLAFFGMSLLAANYAGAALILLGVGLFVGELKAGGHGAFAVSGAVALFVGSLLLFNSPEPALRLGMEWITVVTLLTVTAASTLLVVARRVRLRPVRTGLEGLIHQTGVARSALQPRGKVFVHGELWDAEAEQPVAPGEAVEVIAVREMTLAVRAVRAAGATGG